MSKENSLRSRIWRRMNSAAQRQYDAVQQAEQLDEISRKAQQYVDRETKDITDSGCGREHGDRVVLDSTLIQRDDLPGLDSSLISVEEITDVSEEEFHRMRVSRENSFDPFSEVSDRIRSETFGVMADSVKDEEAQRFLTPKRPVRAHMEEINCDEAAVMLYFTDPDHK